MNWQKWKLENIQAIDIFIDVKGKLVEITALIEDTQMNKLVQDYGSGRLK